MNEQRQCMTCSEVLPRNSFCITAGKFTRICRKCAGMGNQKQCTDCNRVLDVEDFLLIKRRNGGEPYREKRCLGCRQVRRAARKGQGRQPRPDVPMNPVNRQVLNEYAPPPTAEQLAAIHRYECAIATKPRWGVVPVHVVD